MSGGNTQTPAKDVSENLTVPGKTNTDDDAARQRAPTIMDFRSASTGIAAKQMRNEINKLIESVSDAEEKRHFANEMQNFFMLFNRYLQEKARGEKLEWNRVNSPSAEHVFAYKKVDGVDPKILDKLAVVCLNGGLGTTMGCVGPKSVIEVRDGLTFLDLKVRQIEHLNTEYGCQVPLLLMNSFNTQDDTDRVIRKYENHNINILTFQQSRHPRFSKESLLPIARSADDDKAKWYPPGHGDIFDALSNSGLLDKLIAAGKEYIFVSNVDNLGAVVDLSILQSIIDKQAEYVMEVTDKTKADVKGGTIIDYDGQVRLLEVAQVPADHVEDFKSVKKFKIFNTNNIWINLKAIKRVIDNDELNLEIIVNNKVTDSGEAVIQLETAIGAAIKHFKNAAGINVPRSRFLPVKSCSDLLLIKSGLYNLEHGVLTMNPSREFQGTPVVKLGDTFKKVANFEKRFKSIPDITELDHLTINGDVWVGKKVTFAGTVIIVANEGNRIQIPDGTILENKLVSGNLAIIDH
ncbi:putative UTP--glucose-1-phosphate uridylyltransferase [Naganishia cerealis]|uniref:UTP--glucose-1-phosphate uridylyltransferase n=1 Tax=Naganishia cerealis TaxID=610337 RepID=A0ACC2WGZ5_9TREE|nr:putative UTP--glucose-1-phosphate uridylyltransferase [Naganishia cerealis]